MPFPVSSSIAVVLIMLAVVGVAIAVGTISGGETPPEPGCQSPGSAAGPAHAKLAPPSPPPTVRDRGSGGEVLFHDGFESGTFDDWYVQALDRRATIVSPGAFDSDHAARFEVRDGDEEPDTGSERAEVSGPTVREGQELYVRDSFRIPSGSSIGTSWTIINQLHEEEWDGSPGLAVFLEPDPCPSLEIAAGGGSPTFVDDVPLEFDRWHDLVYRVKLSQDPDAGFVEAWLDGRRLRLSGGRARAEGQTLQGSRAYLKAGIYRSGSTGTTVVEHDNITIATSLDAALAAD